MVFAVIVESNGSLDRLKTICAQMTKATNEFRRCLLEVKEVHARQIERLQRERDAALMAARVHTDVDDSNNMHHIPGVELQTTKKVTSNACKIPMQNSNSNFCWIYSVRIVTEKQWPSVHYADERHTVQHFVSEKIGIHIRSNVHVIPTRVHSKLCCWSTSKPNIVFNDE